MPSNRTRSRSLRALVLSLVVVSLAAVGATSASAAVTLDWTQPNVFETSVPGTDRTWLGYVTNSANNAGPPSLGSQVASDGAIGPDVTTASARGANALYTVAFPAAAGSLIEEASPADIEGEFTFSGKITWTTHGTPITFTNPRIVLNGDGTGALYATGVNDTTAYNETTGPVFDLDLDGQAPDPGAPASSPGTQAGFAAAVWKLNFDGTRSISGIVPKIATPNTTAAAIFGASYAAGVGPDRLPHRFGSFAISISPNTGTAGTNGTNGAAGPQGPIGPAGPAGKDATVKTITLKKAIFGKKAKVLAKVTKNGKFVGYAEINDRKAKVTYITATLRGTYKLTTVGAKKKRSANVKF
ncbi:MAG: hypothetical protein HYX29_09280 [Solirubrobacterales bacterium]|nr:hypothetical protein [Solirubrobacterales bacterium]